ncbi:homocysteine S-methyltransferase family protein [Quadrisphaera sp. INWT6]|uniref:homocysteine S-methyltransferase family protein n=1 Tax=Quadrisphaera sp. INWT6 TaxID=2596917 RepID=UPI0035CCD6CE
MSPWGRCWPLRPRCRASWRWGSTAPTPPSSCPACALSRACGGAVPVVYPNSGEGWDAAARAWRPGSPELGAGADPRGWVAAGARLVGGCCRVGPEQVRAVARAVGVLGAVRS